MLMVISPAKTLDYSGADYPHFTVPEMLIQSEVLVQQLSTYEPLQLSDLMKISDKLAELNHQRYQNFETPFTPENAKQALLVFNGDVYRGIRVSEYDKEALTFAQKHLRILSGLYGVLRPLDLMQPYRLEMGTKLKTKKGKNLYEFWGTRIAECVNEALASETEPCLVNLASNEYFKSIDQKTLKAKVLNIAFKENKNGVYKIVTIYAKRARGLMVEFAIRHQVENVEQLKDFDTEGYRFSQHESEPDNWVFCRD